MRADRTTTCVFLALVVLLGVGERPARAGGAAAYYQWLQTALIGVWEDVPQISASATQAAQLFVAHDWNLGAAGDISFIYEFINRAGGVMPIVFPVKPGEGEQPQIILFAPREDQLEQDWEQVRACQRHGDRVIAFVRPEILAQALAAGVHFDEALSNHAAPHGGLFLASDGQEWIVPTDRVGNIIALWAWIGEFVAACTRLGQMPTMWQSVMVPGARERNPKFRPHRFHTYAPVPVPAGWAAREYLRSLRSHLITLHYLEGSRMRLAAELALATSRQGHTLWAGGTGHSFTGLIGCPHDPGLFQPLNPARWWDMRKLPDFAPGDLALCIGYDGPFAGEAYHQWAERARAAGVRLIWSFTDYHPEVLASLPPDEFFINQRWALGDAVVPFPGYDVKLLPPSGVLGEAVLWMITAEMLASS
ncbi:MAG: hypothetical protein GX100_02505 [candidate division WS1 bacterium]|nr:hypothetical protein [candidate division WS1 bacterium]